LTGIASGTHQICAWAINVGPGTNRLLRCGLVTVGGGPVGSLDVATPGPGGIVHLAGWALDPDVTAPLEVRVYVDNGYWLSWTASGSRPDIGAAFPNYGSNHGFSGTLAGIATGTHQICTWAINVAAGDNHLLRCALLQVGGDPVGAVDVVSATVSNDQPPAGGGMGVSLLALDGWTLDPDVTGPIDVRVYVDDVFQVSATASNPRYDIGAAYPDYGPNHGFHVLVSEWWSANSVCIWAINTASGVNKLLSCPVQRIWSATPALGST
jgi:hypothetical protein